MIIKKINFDIDKKNAYSGIFNSLPSFDFTIYREKEVKIAKFVLLIGKNGSGKTSLLTLIQKLFDNHEKVYKEYLSDPSSFCRTRFGWFTKVKIELHDEQIDFLFLPPFINDKIFDLNTPLKCEIFHVNNDWKWLPKCLYLTPNTYGDDEKIIEYWNNLYDHEYKERNDRSKYEIRKSYYDDDNISKIFKSNWENFIKQFDDSEWKEKNKKIIEKLANRLDCTSKELNRDKINGLGDEIKNKVKKLIFDLLDQGLNNLNSEKSKYYMQHRQCEDKFKKLEILFWLIQLCDKNYTNWKNFVAQFNNKEWKIKNQEIIMKLAELLNRDFDGINAQEVEELDSEIKNNFRQKVEIIDKTELLRQIVKELELYKNKIIFFV